MLWHTKDISVLIEELKTTEQGLSSEEARKRLTLHGPNKLVEKKKRGPIFMLLDQFKDFMILVLIAAAIISGIIGEPTDTIAIIVIVILNAIVGFVQEYRAEKAMEALKKMATPKAILLRDGKTVEIPSEEIVPGDIVLLTAGDVVPADIRLLEISQLKVEEAALTGESMAVEKTLKTIKDEDAPLGDRKNMLYKGTIVVSGRGKGIVVATGMKTELGRIASMLQEEEEVKTPLQKRLKSFGQRIAISVIAICVILFVIGIIRGEEPLKIFLTAVSLAVAAIPEALPAVVTISLAFGAKKMVKQNALIRKLPAVETLGSVTYICTDKTGTLTLNKMTVKEHWLSENRTIAFDTDIENLFFTCVALSNDARQSADGNLIGEPTETALYRYALDKGYKKEDLEIKFPRVAEIPFDSKRKCMTTIHKWHNGKFISITKGATETLLQKETNTSIHKEISRVTENMAKQGLRVISLAIRLWDRIPSDISPETIEEKLHIIGLIGMMDPPRHEAKEAVGMCRKAGIHPVMITGDHPITAETIAKAVGIIEEEIPERSMVITGQQLEKMSIEELREQVDKIKVYARVAPEQKLKIVKALQDKDQYVAMTGDGVNDAPALKRADIGIAMGITGTDVAKEAAHMILLDDNFATIVKAIKEGRRIYDNIRKFIRYTMTSNSGEIWTIFLAPFLGLPIPLLPIHILWINLVTDGLPGLALAAEPAEKDIMQRPPRNPKESIFAKGLGTDILWVGLLMGFVCLFTQAYAIKTQLGHWQTMVFNVLCLSQMGNVLAVRSEKESLFKQGLFSNKFLLAAVIFTFLLQMATIYLPPLNPVFKTEPLTFNELLFTLVMSSIVFFAVELKKLIIMKLFKR